jgi:hypothetical protein
VRISKRQQATRARIAAQLADAGFAMPGSLTITGTRCGKTGCGCQSEPPRLHGPYALWTRKVNGKTVTRKLSEAELATYRPWFDNAKRLRALLGELQALTLEIVEGPTPTPPSNKKGTRERTGS